MRITKKVNPYNLVWYRVDWSKTKTEKNNAKYWEWEIMYNGFALICQITKS